MEAWLFNLDQAAVLQINSADFWFQFFSYTDNSGGGG